MLADFPFQLLYAFLFIAIPYYPIGFNPDLNRFLITVAILVIVASVASSFGNNLCTILICIQNTYCWYFFQDILFLVLLHLQKYHQHCLLLWLFPWCYLEDFFSITDLCQFTSNGFATFLGLCMVMELWLLPSGRALFSMLCRAIALLNTIPILLLRTAANPIALEKMS